MFLTPSSLPTSGYLFIFNKFILFYFIFHICDVENLAKFGPKFAKLVKITLEKHINPKFPRFSCGKKRKFASKKNTASNLNPLKQEENDSLYLVPTQTLECVIAFLVFLCLLLFVGYSGASGPTPCCRYTSCFTGSVFHSVKHRQNFGSMSGGHVIKWNLFSASGAFEQTKCSLHSAGRQVVPSFLSAKFLPEQSSPSHHSHLNPTRSLHQVRTSKATSSGIWVPALGSQFRLLSPTLGYLF